VLLVAILVCHVVVALARVGIDIDAHDVAEKELATEALANVAAEEWILARLCPRQRNQFVLAAERRASRAGK
jgi:hypothetical protein